IVDNEFLERAFENWDEQNLYFFDIYSALERAQGFYTIDSRFFSAPDNQSRVSAEVLKETQAHPEQYAFVFFDFYGRPMRRGATDDPHARPRPHPPPRRPHPRRRPAAHGGGPPRTARRGRRRPRADGQPDRAAVPHRRLAGPATGVPHA